MREDGFYWVLTYGRWEVAEWSQDYESWAICGDDVMHTEEFVDKIDERRIERNDK